MIDPESSSDWEDSIGMINLAWLRALPGWRQVLRDEPVPGSVRATAAISLLTWVAAVFAGRWIAFL